MLVEVESHPFPTDAMLFMDWRDDHTAADPDLQRSNRWGFQGYWEVRFRVIML